MTEDEIRQFIGSGLQQLMVKNAKQRLAEFFRLWIEAKPDELLVLQAQASAYWRINQEISLEERDLERLSAESVDKMEEMRREQQKGLDELMRSQIERASRSL